MHLTHKNDNVKFNLIKYLQSGPQNMERKYSSSIKP